MLFQLRMQMNSTKMRDAKLNAFKAMIAIAAPSKQQVSSDGSHIGFSQIVFIDRKDLQLRILSKYYHNHPKMAYLDREQSIAAWATIVTGQQVTSLRKIKQPQFISLLLSKLDNNYFAPIFESFPPEHFSISQLYKQITKYYKTEIGTNISQLLGEQINFYSNSSIEDAWQLMLGIATKGNNRQYNINQILKMDGKYQEELGRIVSKVINMFGGNVSQLDQGPNRASSGFYEENNDFFFEISQENEQLKEKVDEYQHQIAQLKENVKNLKRQLEKEGKLKKSLLEVMISEDTQISYGINDNISNQAAIIDCFRDVLMESSRKNRELSRKDEKLSNYEETIKDLKFAYSTILIELQQSRKIANQSNTQVYNQESQLQQLRKQIQQYMERERQWIEKIEELNEQKFYLKGIVQRLQKQSSFTPEKIDQLVALKIKEKQKDKKQDKYEEEHLQKGLPPDNLLIPKIRVPQGSIISESPEQRKTVKYDIDQCKQPSLKNKLQREVSHLQKKINSLTSQNLSLKKLNSVLEKVINDFTADSQKLVDRIENEYEPMVEQLEKKVKEIIENGIEEGQKKEKQFDEVLEQIMQVFKEKIDMYQEREKEQKEVINKLERERGALLEQIRESVENNEIKNEVKSLKISGQHKLQIKSEKLQLPAKNQQIQQKQKQQSQKQSSEEEESNEAPLIMITKPTLQPTPKPANFLSTPAVSLTIPNSQPHQLMGSIIVHEEEQQINLGMRPRQYSYMQNRNSCIQDQFNFAEKGSQFVSKVEESCYVDIKEDAYEHSQLDENMEDVEIIDVTEMEEQLEKIKQKYMRITEKNNQLYERIISQYESIKSEKEKERPVKRGVDEVLQKIKKTSLEGSPEGLGIKGKDLKDIEQYIKICHQNKVLKAQLSNVLKERNLLQNKISSLQSPTQLPSNSQSEQLLQKSYSLIRQLQKTLKQTTHQYLQLHNYFTDQKNLPNDGQKQRIIDSQQILIAELEQEVQKKGSELELVLQENRLMLSAMLDWRNISSNRGNTKHNMRDRNSLKKKLNLPKREQPSNTLQIANRSRNRTINQSTYLKN